MDLKLTEAEAHTLRDVLRDYVPDLRREVAATDVKDFRHQLVVRLDLIERLLAELDREVPA